MKKTLYIILFFIVVANCSFKPIDNFHGVSYLDIKQKSLYINKTNKNDIIKYLGAPSTKNIMNKNLWIYIENRKSKSSIFKLGKNVVKVNNVLLLEIDKNGILKDKKFYNIDDQNNIIFTKNKTELSEKDTFVYSVVSSIRQKIDSPKRNRTKK